MNRIHIDKKWLKQKYSIEKMSCQKIGNITGYSGGGIRKILIRMRIPINDRIYNRNKFLNDKKWLKQKYIDHMMSSLEIAKIIKCNNSSVRNALRRFGLKVRSKLEASICNREDDGLILCGESLDIINGSLLGDASICRFKKNGISVGRPYLVKTNIGLDHIEYVASKIFGDEYQKRVFRGPTPKLKNRQQTFIMRSLVHEQLYPLYKKWYDEKNVKGEKNQKRVPDDLKINGKVLLHWFMDDGCSINHYKRYPNPRHNRVTLQIFLCTQGFYKKDVDKLIKKIYEGTGIKATKRFVGTGFGYVIFISERDIDKFYKTIGQCPVPSMQYKWKSIKKPKYNEKLWNKKFIDLKQFVYSNKRYPLSAVNYSNEYRLYQWMSTQKMARNGTVNITLSKEKIKKMESLPLWKWRQ